MVKGYEKKGFRVRETREIGNYMGGLSHGTNQLAGGQFDSA